MRFVSPYPRYSIQVKAQDSILVPDAQGIAREIIKNEQVVCDFQQGGIMEWEVEAAFERFTFSGLAEGVNPVTQLSVFDTEGAALSFGWDDTTRAAVEEKLLTHAGSDYIHVAKPKVATPWGNYDQMSAEDILATQKTTDFDPTHIRLYEHENKARVTVLKAMEELEGLALAGGAVEEVMA